MKLKVTMTEIVLSDDLEALMAHAGVEDNLDVRIAVCDVLRVLNLVSYDRKKNSIENDDREYYHVYSATSDLDSLLAECEVPL